MKIKLTVPERLAVIGVLPEKGSYATLRILDELKKKLSFSAKELKFLKLQQVDEKIQWNAQKDGKGKEIDYNEFEVGMIERALKELNDKEELLPAHFSIYKKFIEKDFSEPEVIEEEVEEELKEESTTEEKVEPAVEPEQPKAE